MRTLPFVLSAVVIAGCAAGHRPSSTAAESAAATPSASASTSSSMGASPSASAGAYGAAPSAGTAATATPSVSNAPPATGVAPVPNPAPDTSVAGAGKPGARANAKLAPTAGNKVTGSVQFVQAGPRVTVSGEIRGLKPNSEHGFHIHEKGDCSAPDGTSAGGHFNPDGRQHGKFGEGTHHRGDLPSLKADGAGVARFEFDARDFNVDSGPDGVLGKSLVVHADPDDFKTQPAGNSGARVACGVINKA